MNIESLLKVLNGRGGIECPELYVRAKMLDHTDWVDHLPRNITPSDIDMVFDNRGRIIQIELSPSIDKWEFLQVGQRELHFSYVRAGKGAISAVIARHNTPPDRYINSYKDVISWTLAYYDQKTKDISFRYFIHEPPITWPAFISWWFMNGFFE